MTPQISLGRRLLLQCLGEIRLRSCNSLNNRTFSMAITAWFAKVSSSAICFSVNGRTSIRRIMMVPIATPSRSSGVASTVRIPRLLEVLAWTVSSGSAARS